MLVDALANRVPHLAPAKRRREKLRYDSSHRIRGLKSQNVEVCDLQGHTMLLGVSCGISKALVCIMTKIKAMSISLVEAEADIRCPDTALRMRANAT